MVLPIHAGHRNCSNTVVVRPVLDFNDSHQKESKEQDLS